MKVSQALKGLVVSALISLSLEAYALPTGVVGSLSLGNRSGHAKISDGFDSDSGSSDNDTQYLGLKVGYAQLQSRELGYLVRGTLLSKLAGSAWAAYTELRPEVSGAYGFNDIVFGQAGLHLSGFLSGFEGYGLGKGLQFGVGFALNPQMVFEAQYYITNFSFKKSGYDVDMTLSSLELSLSYVF